MRPEAVPGLRRLTEAVHAEGAAAAAQIGHAGPVSDASSTKLPAISAGKFFDPPGMRFTKVATAEDIERITRAHAEAARLAIEADPSTPSLCIHCNRCVPTICKGTHCPEIPA